jgi:hypothetical protein
MFWRANYQVNYLPCIHFSKLMNLQYAIDNGAHIARGSSGYEMVSTTSQLARKINERGWVSTTKGGSLLWLPADNRLVDDSSMCISTAPSRRRMVLDFSKFVHGSSWTKVACV